MEENKNNKSIGIREIAKLAGVSTATVSRVINKSPSTSQKVREKVEKIIEEYNYIPNQNIRNIFSKSYNSIAIFIYDIDNPFFTRLIKELNKICLTNKYTLLICDTENEKNRENEYLEYCLANRFSGIIVTEGIDYSIFETHELNLPIVTLDRKINKHFSVVSSENVEAAKNVVEYLYNLNHRKIAFVGCANDYMSVISRKEGYLKGLNDKNILFRAEYIYEKGEKLDLENGTNALKYFLTLSDPPTAIICANDIIALGIINEARVQNLLIPDDISIVGFDNVIDLIHYPTITTVKQDLKKMANLLFDLITNPPESPKSIKIDTKLIQGYTTKRCLK